MSLAKHQPAYRELPSVDELLGRPPVKQWIQTCSRDLVVHEIRSVLAEIRRSIAEGRWEGVPERAGSLEELVEERVGARLQAIGRGSLRRVINASGVILHTNLGRAPLSARALRAIQETAGGYSNLEYDLEAGRRGKRDVHAGRLLERVLGAPAIVVNNNAAAVFLVLNELAAGGEVVVSRGELIEIGDGFRIPDIMARSGARLREVGTTNRTRIEDYRAAIGEETRLLLRVHRSNFRIVGFTSRPSLEEMASLSRDTGVPVMEDLGSGCLYDLAGAGLDDEPPVPSSLEAGVDIVTFSGDKLLGGPQAGIITGRKELVDRVRRNPLFRALRVGKLGYAALEATLVDYLCRRYDEIPVLRMARATAAEIRSRAERFIEQLDPKGVRADLISGESVLGGGSTPAQSLPTTLVRVQPPRGLSVSSVEQRLRGGDPPVIARLENDCLLIDLRTVFPDEEAAMIHALRQALSLAADGPAPKGG